MKTGLDKSSSNIKEDQIAHYAWAKGFVYRGKRQFHPYTLIKPEEAIKLV